jgi:MFS family permease
LWQMGKGPEKSGTRRLVLLGAAHSSNHSLFLISSPLLTVIVAGLNVNLADIGLVATIASLIYGVGSLVGGPLGDRIGEVKTIIISLTFSGLATLIMLATGLVSTIYIYALSLITMAVFASLYHPTANSLISKAFKTKVSESMGIHGVGGTIGTVLTPTIAWFIGITFGWQWSFVVFGILCVVLALIFIKSFKGAEVRDNAPGSILDALKIRELWVLLIFNVAIGLFMKGVELYFPTYVKTNRLPGLNPQDALMWSSIAYTLVLAVGVPAQWIGGRYADRISPKKVLIATSTGVCISLLSILLVPMYTLGIGLFIVLYGLSFYAHQPALNSLTGLLSPQNQRGAVFGIFFFTSFGIGSLSQFIAGYMGDVYGLDAAFWLLAIFALIALILSFFLPGKKSNE